MCVGPSAVFTDGFLVEVNVQKQMFENPGDNGAAKALAVSARRIFPI